jgi:hypothetical protein
MTRDHSQSFKEVPNRRRPASHVPPNVQSGQHGRSGRAKDEKLKEKETEIDHLIFFNSFCPYSFSSERVACLLRRTVFSDCLFFEGMRSPLCCRLNAASFKSSPLRQEFGSRISVASISILASGPWFLIRDLVFNQVSSSIGG